MVLADKKIQQGDLVMGEKELQMYTVLIQKEKEEGGSEEEQKMLLHNRRKAMART